MPAERSKITYLDSIKESKCLILENQKYVLGKYQRIKESKYQNILIVSKNQSIKVSKNQRFKESNLFDTIKDSKNQLF